MHKRLLGDGLAVSALGYGCMGLTGNYGPNPGNRNEMKRLLHQAVDLGVTFFDTAEAYGPYLNEELVGEGLRHFGGEEVQIGTKFGWRIEDGALKGLDSTPTQIRRVADSSLRRLGVDAVDLFMQHRVDPRVPIEDVAGTVGELVNEGKVRHFGLSEASVATVQRANSIHPVAAVESEYSLWTREPEDSLLPFLTGLGIGFIAFSPLGRGFLTGSVSKSATFAKDDIRSKIPRFSEVNRSKNQALVDHIRTLGRDRGATPGQVALAWLLAKGPSIVPIPGTRRLERLRENVGSTRVELSADDVAKLDRLTDTFVVHGARYDAELASFVDE